QKKAREALRTAESACEILHLDPTATDKQLARADDVKERKREALDDIDEKIADMKVKHKSAQKVYRKRATEIFRQCESVEEERLDHIRETLLDFLETMDTSKYARKVEQIFTDIKDKVTKEQNSFDDRVFWAKSYGIENKLTKSLTLASNGDDAENDSIIIESRTNKKKIDHETEKKDRRQSIVERVADDEEASAAINSTTPAKTKVKRTKSITNTDKKTITEPSTINNTVLNQV
ncbi:unnamed protein product, partial [Rotaria socialis]